MAYWSSKQNDTVDDLTRYVTSSNNLQYGLPSAENLYTTGNPISNCGNTSTWLDMRKSTKVAPLNERSTSTSRTQSLQPTPWLFLDLELPNSNACEPPVFLSTTSTKKCPICHLCLSTIQLSSRCNFAPSQLLTLLTNQRTDNLLGFASCRLNHLNRLWERNFRSSKKRNQSPFSPKT